MDQIKIFQAASLERLEVIVNTFIEEFAQELFAITPIKQIGKNYVMSISYQSKPEEQKKQRLFGRKEEKAPRTNNFKGDLNNDTEPVKGERAIVKKISEGNM